MRRVRGFGGGGLSIAVLLVLLIACAKGSNDTPDDLDASADDSSSGGPRDVNVIPKDTGPEPDSSSSGSDTSTGCATKKVLVNEVQTQGAAASDEFVEIYNPTDCAISLANWTLQYRAKTDGLGVKLHSFASGDTIESKTYLWFSAGAVAGTPDGPLSPGMAAADGQVGLLDDTGKLVDGVAYGAVTSGTYLEGSAAPSPPANGSIARKPVGIDSGDNSKDWKTATTPSPGVVNP